jgi:hypothetical protein
MGDDAEEKLQQGIEHLQAAAREMIKATRSLLDAAEELVDDPRAVQDLVGTLAHVAQAAAGRFRPGGHEPDDGEGGHVQRIRVS